MTIRTAGFDAAEMGGSAAVSNQQRQLTLRFPNGLKTKLPPLIVQN